MGRKSTNFGSHTTVQRSLDTIIVNSKDEINMLELNRCMTKSCTNGTQILFGRLSDSTSHNHET